MSTAQRRRQVSPGPARAPLHVQSRPFPGIEPAATPDLATTAAEALGAARGSLARAHARAHPTGCRCSAWCRDEWVYAALGAPAFGHCVVCNELARSIDPDGNVRHPSCKRAAAKSPGDRAAS